MFQLAFLIGIYSNIIFSLGILHLLNRELIFLVTIPYIFCAFFIIRPTILSFWEQIKNNRLKILSNKLTIFLFALILIQAGINLIGALGPELGFDALWYHLTMPKIYLQEGKIFYIGGHLYYSAMPQLTEMYYLVSLALGSEIVAKVIHFLFGILSLIALYKMARLFFSVRDSLLALLIFYSNLSAGWMSITAYIDLARTFFEIMALWAFLIFIKSARLKWLGISAVIVGFTASTKILSLGSIILYLLLLIFLKFSANLRTRSFLKLAAAYTGIAFAVVSPWLLFSYLSTGSPIYPVLSSGFHPTTTQFSLNLMRLLKQGAQIFLLSPDPISPIYTLCLPLIGLYFWKIGFKKVSKELSLTANVLIIYVFFNIVTLYFAPPESSGRFILPFLPAFTLLFVLLLKNIKSKFLYRFLFIAVLLISLSSIAYRGIANKRFIPYLFGKITLPEFMAKNMEFQVGNFYDLDGYFQKTIKSKDKVLIYGISNLFYVNFPYIHQSFVKQGDQFNYVLIKDSVLPERFKDWQLIYQNRLTRVKLYSLDRTFSVY